MSGIVCDQQFLVTFRADRETAKELADATKVTLAALTDPTEENASALFKLGAEAVVRAAEARRARPLAGEPSSFVPCAACGVALVDPTQTGADGLSICDDCREAPDGV